MSDPLNITINGNEINDSKDKDNNNCQDYIISTNKRLQQEVMNLIIQIMISKRIFPKKSNAGHI